MLRSDLLQLPVPAGLVRPGDRGRVGHGAVWARGGPLVFHNSDHVTVILAAVASLDSHYQ